MTGARFLGLGLSPASPPSDLRPRPKTLMPRRGIGAASSLDIGATSASASSTTTGSGSATGASATTGVSSTTGSSTSASSVSSVTCAKGPGFGSAELAAFFFDVKTRGLLAFAAGVGRSGASILGRAAGAAAAGLAVEVVRYSRTFTASSSSKLASAEPLPGNTCFFADSHQFLAVYVQLFS